jgi:hypothetical protein
MSVYKGFHNGNSIEVFDHDFRSARNKIIEFFQLGGKSKLGLSIFKTMDSKGKNVEYFCTNNLGDEEVALNYKGW